MQLVHCIRHLAMGTGWVCTNTSHAVTSEAAIAQRGHFFLIYPKGQMG